MAKTFTDVVESAVAALYKKRKPEPKTLSGKAPYAFPDTSKKAVQRARVEGNPPDLGKTEVEEYSGLEKNVQRAETLDSVISNTSFASDIAGQIPKLAKAARVVSTVGKAAEPVQAALWMLDSARATADPKYRAEAEKAVTGILESDSQPVVKQLRVAASTVARPVSTIRGMLDSVSESNTRKLNAELRGEAAQRRLKDLGESFEQKRAEADVPEVDIRKGDKQRTERVARKFFK